MAKRMSIQMTDPIFEVGVNAGHRPVVWNSWINDGFEHLEDWLDKIVSESLSFHRIGVVPVINPIHKGIPDEMNALLSGWYHRAEVEPPRRFMIEYDEDAHDLSKLQVRHVASKSGWADLGVSTQWQLISACYSKLADRNLTAGFGSNRLHLTIAGAVAVSTIMGFPVKG